jgi:chromosome segregation ATPase
MSLDPRTHGTSLPSTPSERRIRDINPSVEAELRLQLMQLRDHAIGTTAQVGELRARLQEKEVELQEKEVELRERERELEKKSVRVKNLDQQEARLRASLTWRIGSFFMLPIRILRRLLRGS